jgi:hypothetical protein
MEVSHLKLQCQIPSSSRIYPSYSHVVRREQRSEERNVNRGREPVLFRFVGSHVDDRINVGLCYRGVRIITGPKEIPQAHEWNARKVPEDDHEAPLFVEHIPRLWDTLFTFAAFQSKVSSGEYLEQNRYSPRVQIKPGRKTHECHILGDDTQLKPSIMKKEWCIRV